jgi:hypothetical protein
MANHGVSHDRWTTMQQTLSQRRLSKHQPAVLEGPESNQQEL